MLRNQDDFEFGVPDELKAEIIGDLITQAEHQAKKFRTNEILMRIVEILFVFIAISIPFQHFDNQNTPSLINLAIIIGALASHAQANYFKSIKEKIQMEKEHMQRWKGLY